MKKISLFLVLMLSVNHCILKSALESKKDFDTDSIFDGSQAYADDDSYQYQSDPDDEQLDDDDIDVNTIVNEYIGLDKKFNKLQKDGLTQFSFKSFLEKNKLNSSNLELVLDQARKYIERHTASVGNLDFATQDDLDTFQFMLDEYPQYIDAFNIIYQYESKYVAEDKIYQSFAEFIKIHIYENSDQYDPALILLNAEEYIMQHMEDIFISTVKKLVMYDNIPLSDNETSTISFILNHQHDFLKRCVKHWISNHEELFYQAFMKKNSFIIDAFVLIYPKFIFKNGESLLTVAIKSNNNDLFFRVFNNVDVEVNHQDDAGNSILMLAIIHQASTQIIHALLSHPLIDLNLVDQKGNNALMLAIMHQASIQIIRDLLSHPVIDLNLVDKKGNNALMLAIIHRLPIEIIRLLLEKKDNTDYLDINHQNDHRETALMLAVQYNLIAIVRFLLSQQGIDLNLQDSIGQTALMIAHKYDHMEIVVLLLHQSGINPNLQNIKGKTVLMFAVFFGKLDIVKLLLSYPEINVNLQDIHGKTALMIAVSGNELEIVRLLLSQPGIDLNLQDEYGRTARSLCPTAEMKALFE